MSTKYKFGEKTGAYFVSPRSLGYLKFSFVSDSADLQSVPTQYIDKMRR
jgi:hypothetical protein